MEDPAQNLRTIRHRENKRRYRARQREYIESLQRRLADTRDQQVAGMKEVQLAGQKVVKDNSQLRALLRFIGVDDDITESWLREVEIPAKLLPLRDALTYCLRIPKPVDLNITSNKSTQTSLDLQHELSLDGSYPNDTALELVALPPSQSTVSTLERERLQNKSPSPALETSYRSRPCMSVPHILAQPTIEPQGVTDPASRAMVNDDVECSAAQKLVLSFATTSDKVDAISQKLKEGCIIDKCGGCKVKANVMWDILEDAMNGA